MRYILKDILLSYLFITLVAHPAYAQMIPGSGPMVPNYTGSGTVSQGPANAVPYWAVAGNKIVPMAPANNAVLITGPTGVPSLGGTRSGTTTEFATVGTTPVSGSCAQWDGSLNITSTGAPCSTSSGSVNPGTINEMAWYAATGSTVSGLPTANNGVLVTSNTGVPSIGTTLPLLVQTNITELGTITTGVWNATVVTVTYGGTGDATFTPNGVIYGNGTSPLQVTAQGGANSVLTANSGAPTFSSTPSVTSLTATTALNLPFISPDSVPYINGSNDVIGSTFFTFNGVTLTVPIVSLKSILLNDASGPGTITIDAPNTTFSNYSMTFPTTSGSAGQPLLSAGGGSVPMTWGTLSGNTTEFATVGTTPTSGACAQWDGSGNITSTGSPCSGSSGSVNPGTINDLGWYSSTGSTISALATANNGVLVTSAGGVPSIGSTLPSAVQGNITQIGAVTTGGSINNIPIGATTPSTGAFTTLTDTGLTTNDVVYAGSGGLLTGLTTSPFGVLNTDGSGVPSITDSPTIGSLITVPNVIGGSAPNSNLTIMSTSSGSPAGDFIDFEVGAGSAMMINDSGQSTFSFMVQVPSEAFVGSSSGAVTIQPDPNAGTYTMTLPTTPGTAGQVLTSAGGGAADMTWTTPSTGSGTVNPGTIDQLAWYNATGAAVSGLATANNGVLVTSAAGVPSISSTLPTAVQGNITSLGTITSGVWNGTSIAVPNGGTGVGTFTTNGVLYGNGTSPLSMTAQGGSNTVLAANNGAPFFTGGPNVNAINLVGTSSGTITLIAPGTAFTPWTFNFPLNAGSAGQPLLSAGGTGSPQTYGTLSVGGGGTGDTTFTTNGVVYGNGTSALNVTAQGAANTVLTANAGAPAFSAAPTIGTSVTTPQIYGGTAAASQLRITATSNGSPSSDKVFVNAGGLIKLVVDDGGVFVSQGAPGSNATAQLEIAGGSGAAGSAQLKFASSTLLGTPEAGAVEYDGGDLYFSPNSTRRTFQIGTMAAIPAATLSTSNTTVASLPVVSGEKYIVDITLNLTSSANTVIVGFTGTNMNGETLAINQIGTGLVTVGAGQLVANSASTVTCIGNATSIKISGEMSAASTGTFSVQLHTNTSTVPLLAGSYYNYTRL